MTGKAHISVDSASMRIVDGIKVLPDGMLVMTDEAGKLLPPLGKIESAAITDRVSAVFQSGTVDATLRALMGGFERAAVPLMALRAFLRPGEDPPRPLKPSLFVTMLLNPVERARLERMYTAQLRVRRRVLRRRRRQRPGPKFDNYRRFSKIYAPSVRFSERPDGDLEAQLGAWQPKD